MEKDKSRLIQKAIVEDEALKNLYAMLEKIYSIAVPQVCFKNGKHEIIWIDETNHPEIKKIQEIISSRIEQIKNFYS